MPSDNPLKKLKIGLQTLTNQNKGSQSSTSTTTILETLKKNLSAIQVAKSPAIFSENPPYFGILTITDDPLTVGPEISSKIVGYGQGFYATSSLEEVSMLMGVTFVFTDGEYNGSTLAVLGRNPIGEMYSRIGSCRLSAAAVFSV
ncbi:hypothetical protein ACS0TY_019968 [Phlomoides rotata]